MNQPKPTIEIMEQQTVYHLSTDISYLMGLPNTKLQRMFKDQNGEHPNALEVREMLSDLVRDGIKCIPVGVPNCDRWDNEVGCLGHLKAVASV
jgi:hypothetical protein